MRYGTAFLASLLLSSWFQPLSAKDSAEEVKAPMARIVPKNLEIHGHVRVDDYYWLNQRENPDVIDYLNAENEYTKTVMAHTEALQENLFEEIKGRIKQTDESVPYKLDDYLYYTRYEDGKEYPIYCRKKGAMEAPEQIMLDVNVMAEGHEFFSVRRRRISSDQDILAYAEDTQGRRIYTIKFKNLDSGGMLGDVIPEVTGGMAWANDNKTLFYAKQDPATLRSYRVYRHVLGTDVSKDKLVYEETDDTFSCYVWKTKSKKFVLIGSVRMIPSSVTRKTVLCVTLPTQ